ncbi:hypothetical protein DPMN_099520 [Dreissena polymorpha]|uniref:Uncharacterized protein n=1 Tax=Dreissena polymorpha TaxID=45954 RepID=A0A9D4LE68_DREPO|nr:hypothetical protein DPMN_099520 [Dreissena polymorpha]
MEELMDIPLRFVRPPENGEQNGGRCGNGGSGLFSTRTQKEKSVVVTVNRLSTYLRMKS